MRGTIDVMYGSSVNIYEVQSNLVITGSHGDILKWSQLRGGRFNETLYIRYTIDGSGQNCP